MLCLYIKDAIEDKFLPDIELVHSFHQFILSGCHFEPKLPIIRIMKSSAIRTRPASAESARELVKFVNGEGSSWES